MEQANVKDVQLVGEVFVDLINRYNRMMNKKNLYKDLKDLTLIEINTIIVIGRDERVKSMSQIANLLGVSFGTPTVTVDRLIAKGYVERIRDVEDRRQVFVKLSEKGNSVYDFIARLKNEAIQKIFGILDESEREILINILYKLRGKLEEVINERS
ncbi:MAG: MarR family transcriptional regulator [Clostridiales bacterium]|jgi:DNA-binding MarR family transcriptional regulator|nr:MarR family transcriptional regulator [Eubacteriales bacterium]MDH7567245.1 MarR family transcriptional regulator [Clostridiales bacterium]